MKFTVNELRWETNTNRAASRQVSTEKQTALSALIDDILEKEVIRPSKATALGPETKRGGGRVSQ